MAKRRRHVLWSYIILSLFRGLHIIISGYIRSFLWVNSSLFCYGIPNFHGHPSYVKEWQTRYTVPRKKRY